MLEFVCEKCGGNRLEEVMSDVTVASEITAIDENGAVDYGEQTNEDGSVERYQCINCGQALKLGEKSFVTTPEELKEYLTKPRYKPTSDVMTVVIAENKLGLRKRDGNILHLYKVVAESTTGKGEPPKIWHVLAEDEKGAKHQVFCTRDEHIWNGKNSPSITITRIPCRVRGWSDFEL